MTATPCGPSRAKRVVVSLACATAGLLAAEGLLRHALFLSGETGTEGLRNPALYADPHHEEQYWTLLAALEGPRCTVTGRALRSTSTP